MVGVSLRGMDERRRTGQASGGANNNVLSDAFFSTLPCRPSGLSQKKKNFKFKFFLNVLQECEMFVPALWVHLCACWNVRHNISFIRPVLRDKEAQEEDSELVWRV